MRNDKYENTSATVTPDEQRDSIEFSDHSRIFGKGYRNDKHEINSIAGLS
jgi:hypothetical protein